MTGLPTPVPTVPSAQPCSTRPKGSWAGHQVHRVWAYAAHDLSFDSGKLDAFSEIGFDPLGLAPREGEGNELCHHQAALP